MNELEFFIMMNDPSYKERYWNIGWEHSTSLKSPIPGPDCKVTDQWGSVRTGIRYGHICNAVCPRGYESVGKGMSVYCDRRGRMEMITKDLKCLLSCSAERNDEMEKRNLIFADRSTKYAMAKYSMSEIGNGVKLALSCPKSGQGNDAILIGEEKDMYARCNDKKLLIPDGVECCVPPPPSKERLAQCKKADERIMLEAQILTPETDEKAMRRVCELKNMECRFDDDDTPLKRGQCKPQYTHGGYQTKDGKRYKIKVGALVCNENREGETLPIQSDVFSLWCDMSSGSAMPSRCQGEGITSTTKIDIDSRTSITFKLQFAVAGVCLPPDSTTQEHVTEICFTPAYYKAAGIGVGIDHGDGWHFGLTLNLGGVKGGHGSIKVSKDQIKLVAPIPIIPGLGLSVSAGFPGTNDPVLNKIISSMSLSITGGPLSSLASLLRPGSPSSL